MRTYTHQQQQGGDWCGNACMAMIYARHNINIKQADIFNFFRKGNLICAEVAGHLQHVGGLHTAVIKIKDIKKCLTFVQENDMDIIMNHKSASAPTAHFTLFDRLENKTVYGHDPYKQDDFPVPLSKLIKLWERNDKLQYNLVAGNVGIVVSKDIAPLQKLLFESGIVEDILCINTDRWLVQLTT